METLRIAPLAPATTRDWDSIRRAIRARPALALQQAWWAEPETLFAPGQVRVALLGMSLVVHAALRDRDVFNPVQRFNVAAFPHGDIFEIFLQPEGQTAYFEFHITPGGALLQLRWPAPMRELGLDWDAPGDPLTPYKIARWRIRVNVRTVRQGWEVDAEIPLRRIFEEEPPWERSRLKLAFGRYDYTRGRLRPIVSSTALLTERDFHRAAEWHAGELHFH